jgi:hypothetical protein
MRLRFFCVAVAAETSSSAYRYRPSTNLFVLLLQPKPTLLQINLCSCCGLFVLRFVCAAAAAALFEIGEVMH